MNTHADKTQENKSQSVANDTSQMQSSGEPTFQFVDNRPEALQLRKLQEMANNSPQTQQTAQMQSIADNFPTQQQHPIQKKENKTGLPDNLKSGMENLSGMSLDHIEVHYNSSQLAAVQAHAFAQGSEIHVAPRQEQHLPHEIGHVVQQAQGRVKPTTSVGGMQVNDDVSLENEATAMGAKALNNTGNTNDYLRSESSSSISSAASQHYVVQRYAYADGKQVIKTPDSVDDREVLEATYELVDAPNEKQDKAINDLYVRRYATRDEFDRHTTGAPVNVGLIDHLAKWYRLPFSVGFFVLGECHYVVNYRRLVKESNQTGDILGEGGTVPFGHYSETRDERTGKAPTRAVGGTTEHAMESIVAKTAYALASLRDDLHKKLWPQGGTSVKREIRYQNAEEWLDYVDKNHPQVRRDGLKRPYYRDPDDTSVKVILKPEKEAREGNYSRGNTAMKLLKKCHESLETYQQSLDERDVQVDEFMTSLKGVWEAFEKFQYYTPKQKRTLFWVGLKEATDKAGALAKTEIDASTISRGEHTGQALIDLQSQENPTPGLLGKTCTLRDVFMYEAIVDAEAKGFKMAGIGNDHLDHLTGPLRAAGIATISYADFFDNYMIDAM